MLAIIQYPCSLRRLYIPAHCYMIYSVFCVKNNISLLHWLWAWSAMWHILARGIWDMMHTISKQFFLESITSLLALWPLASSLRTIFPERAYPVSVGAWVRAICNRIAASSKATIGSQLTYRMSKKLVIVESKWCFGVITAA